MYLVDLLNLQAARNMYDFPRATHAAPRGRRNQTRDQVPQRIAVAPIDHQ